jgi:hypothetical protein
MFAALGEDGLDLMAGLLKQAHELEGLVCGDTAADDEEDACHGSA